MSHSDKKSQAFDWGALLYWSCVVGIVLYTGASILLPFGLYETFSQPASCSVQDAGTTTMDADSGAGTSTRFATVRCNTSGSSFPPFFETARPGGVWQEYTGADGKKVSFADLVNKTRITNGDRYECIATWRQSTLPFLMPINDVYWPALERCELVPRR